MNQLVREFHDAIAAAWLDAPADIDRLLSVNRDTGKNFAVLMYANVFFDQTSLTVYDHYMRARAGAGDFGTLRRIAGDFLASVGYSLRTDYHMLDSHTLLMRAACALYGLESFSDMAELLQIVQAYLVRLFFWTDLCMPWDAISRDYGALRAAHPAVPE